MEQANKMYYIEQIKHFTNDSAWEVLKNKIKLVDGRTSGCW